MKNNRQFINCYKNRNDIEYCNKLSSVLELENLKKTAIDNPNKVESRYQKLIRIDFCGIAATTLLTNTDIPEQHQVKEKFYEIFKNLGELGKAGFNVRTRFLFVYPYSDFSFSQIEAEKSSFRMTISENNSDDSALNLFSLTTDDFKGSDLYIKQRDSLHEIERLYNRFCLSAPNMDLLNLKFTCLPIHARLIAINNHYFVEPISYAKRDRYSKILATSPIVEFTDQTKDRIEELEDHFRYIWTHPTTLVYEDATNYRFDGIHNLENLNQIKEPQDISFEHKISKFKSRYSHKVDEDKVNKWKFRVERMFRDTTRTIEAAPESETVFIAFSFANGKSTADKFKDYLTEDFPPDTLKVNIVDLNSAKKTLHAELIQKMEEATLGVILFTKDIIEQWESNTTYFSRPNIYFEYGYLLSHIKRFGNPIERITIFFEKGLASATDFQDVGRFEYSKSDLANYIVLVERIIAVNRTLTQTISKKIVDNCIKRLQEAFTKGQAFEDMNGKKFSDYKNEIKGKLTLVILKRFKK